MKVYTKTGDKGTTALVGGNRVSKADDRLELYGTLDELDSFIGLLKTEIPSPYKEFLHKIQENLIQVNALFATDCQEWDEKIGFNTDLIKEIEDKIDEYEEGLEPIKSFLIPGSSRLNALCNVVRTICRRAERQIYHIELLPCQSQATAYINRLSDFFFVLGRKF